jgi:tryptophanase
MKTILNLSGFQAKAARLTVLAQQGKIQPQALYKELGALRLELDAALGIKTKTAFDLVPPFIIKTVQPTSTSTQQARQEQLDQTGYNVFNVAASTITLDLLTDSGTGALSDAAWSKIMSADERYAHSITYKEFIPVAQAVFNKQHILPVHQGRAAEKVVFPALLRKMIEQAKLDHRTIVCLGNTYFDTTFAMASAEGAKVIDAPCPESEDTDTYYAFKGNADIAAMEQHIKDNGAKNIGFIVMTVVNNSIGGQPVSMENLKQAYELAKKNNILFLLDAARIFENAYMIQQREAGYQDKSIDEIVHEITGLADVILMSAKKDAIANMAACQAETWQL